MLVSLKSDSVSYLLSTRLCSVLTLRSDTVYSIRIIDGMLTVESESSDGVRSLALGPRGHFLYPR